MKTLIQIHKEGKYFVAIDLITNVADQGLTESEAVSNLKKGLREHYQVLLELAPKERKLSFPDIEVEALAKASSDLVLCLNFRKDQ
jgi:predicted RNase H-like HicB family nuclease